MWSQIKMLNFDFNLILSCCKLILTKNSATWLCLMVLANAID